MKFSFQNIGFTKSEGRILVLAISVLTIGFCVKYYNNIFGSESKPYDFTQSDLEFKQKSSNEPSPESLQEITSININTATIEELSLLDGIGESLAGEIISFREQSGGFKKPEDIMKVKGIGKGKFEKIKSKIKVE
jgi:comEA protein